MAPRLAGARRAYAFLHPHLLAAKLPLHLPTRSVNSPSTRFHGRRIPWVDNLAYYDKVKYVHCERPTALARPWWRHPHRQYSSTPNCSQAARSSSTTSAIVWSKFALWRRMSNWAAFVMAAVGCRCWMLSISVIKSTVSRKTCQTSYVSSSASSESFPRSSGTIFWNASAIPYPTASSFGLPVLDQELFGSECSLIHCLQMVAWYGWRD